MTNKKAIAVGLLAGGIAIGASAQKKGDGSDYLSFIKNTEKTKSESPLESKLSGCGVQFRTNIEGGVYLTNDNSPFVEASLQAGNRDAGFFGVYGKWNKEAFGTPETTTKVTEKPLIGDQYSRNTQTTTETEFREQEFEFGVKYTKPFGRFDASLGFGLSKTEAWAEKAVRGIESTYSGTDLIESKPYVKSTKISDVSKYTENVASAELGYSPIRGIKASVKADYHIRDKRPELSAKIGFQIGGNKRK